MATVLKINGTNIKQPRDFTVESFNLTKSGRVASGTMKMELIAKKRKFGFAYDVLSGVQLDVILSLIDGTAMFFTLEYEDNGVVKSAMVYAGAVKKKRFRTDGVWYRKDVAFDLIEQ